MTKIKIAKPNPFDIIGDDIVAIPTIVTPQYQSYQVRLIYIYKVQNPDNLQMFTNICRDIQKHGVSLTLDSVKDMPTFKNLGTLNRVTRDQIDY